MQKNEELLDWYLRTSDESDEYESENTSWVEEMLEHYSTISKTKEGENA